MLARAFRCEQKMSQAAPHMQFEMSPVLRAPCDTPFQRGSCPRGRKNFGLCDAHRVIGVTQRPPPSLSLGAFSCPNSNFYTPNAPEATCLRPLDGQIAPMAYNRGIVAISFLVCFRVQCAFASRLYSGAGLTMHVAERAVARSCCRAAAGLGFCS